ncbi:MAG: 4-hydroxythreonine-4-phosphate dehydrogenase PdxA [Legionella sp.]
MKPILVCSGEPAGIGPDICLALAAYGLPIVVLGDKIVLEQRALKLGLTIQFIDYQPNLRTVSSKGTLTVLSFSVHTPVRPGVLDPTNSFYVIKLLTEAIQRCMAGEFAALVTAPVHKAIINDAGIPFSGHTEFFADYCEAETVVMMLASAEMKIALATTHLPLKNVPAAIHPNMLRQTLLCMDASLRKDFNLTQPRILVAGLNPHAGESGYLGREDLDIIFPTILDLKKQGFYIDGPVSADTMFSRKNNINYDAYLAMYHDQGLPVIKYASFGQTANITLGLPIIRTSVDHGTAIEIAGSGHAQADSLIAAINIANIMAANRAKNHD